MKRIQVQKWDVNVEEATIDISIDRTNLGNMETNWDKVKKYVDLYKAGNTDYPAVIVERYEDTDFFEIIDGAHRIKALNFLGIKTVKSHLVVSHNN